MTEILDYINRLKNSGLGKKKSLEFLETFIQMHCSETEGQMDDSRQHCLNCKYAHLIIFCDEWDSAINEDLSCFYWEEDKRSETDD